MLFSDMILLQLAVFILGSCGFLIARYIYTRKHDHTNPFVCPIRFDCHTVVHSDYSRFFGIPVEILGMIYYLVIALSYLFLIFILPASTIFGNFLLAFSGGAFLFSAYLVYVQLFILHKGCSWCFVSAGISTLIFLFSLFIYHFEYMFKFFF